MREARASVLILQPGGRTGLDSAMIAILVGRCNYRSKNCYDHGSRVTLIRDLECMRYLQYRQAKKRNENDVLVMITI